MIFFQLHHLPHTRVNPLNQSLQEESRESLWENVWINAAGSVTVSYYRICRGWVHLISVTECEWECIYVIQSGRLSCHHAPQIPFPFDHYHHCLQCHSTASPNPPCPDWLMWQQLERGLVLLWPRFISPVTRFNTFQAHRIHYQLISRFGSVESTKLWSDISHHITHCPNNSPFATIGSIPFSMHFRSYWR